MSFSLSISSLISFRRQWISSAYSCSVLRNSTCWSFSYFSLSCLLMCQKTFLFHHWSWSWQFLTLAWMVWFSQVALIPFQANSTTSLYAGSLSHIISKLKWGFHFWALHPWVKCNNREQWSEVTMDWCCTFAPWNIVRHAEFATILSRQINVRCYLSLPLHHV